MIPTEFDGDDSTAGYVKGPVLRARTEKRDDGTSTCTIYPANASEEERKSRWLTALNGSYVELCEAQ